MRKLNKLIPAVALAVASVEASAQLVYEPFDYGSASVGTKLSNLTGTPTFSGYNNPQNGFNWFETSTSVAASVNEATIVSGNIATPGGLAAASGNYLSAPKLTKGSRLQLAGLGFKTGTYYYSLTMQITDLTSLATSGTALFSVAYNNGFGTQTGQAGVVGARLRIRRDLVDSTKYNLGIASTDSVPATEWDTSSFTVSDTPFIVGSYSLLGSGTTDTASIWVNPSSSEYGAGNAPAPSKTHVADLNASDVNVLLGSIIIRPESANLASAMFLDEVRVDSSWAGVTPKAGNTWIGTTGDNWTDGTKWSAASAPNAGAAAVNLSGAGGTVNLNAGQTIGTLNIKSTNSYTISGANTLTFDGNRPASADVDGTGAINVSALTNATTGAVLASSHTISSPISITNVGNADRGSLTANIASGQTLTLAGNISGAAGVYLAKTGAGTLVLSGTNSHTGGVRVIGGALQVNSDAALGADPGAPTNNIRLRTGGTLRFGSAFTLDTDRTIFIESFTNNFFAFQGAIDTNGFDVTVGSLITTDTAGGQLVKSGAGRLTLTNAGNAQTSNSVTGGTLRVSSDAHLGLVPGAPATNITLNSGTLQWGASFDPSNNRNLVLAAAGGTLDTDGNNASWGNTISGSGALTKSGAGQLTIGGSNTYVGGTNVNAGTLNIANDANLGAAASSVSFGGGTLKINSSFSNGARAVNVNAGGGTIDTNGFDLAFGNTTGAGSLTKTASGSYTTGHVRTGGLTVNAGSVIVSQQAAPDNASSAAGVSKVTAVSVTGTGKFDIKNNKLITASAIGTHNGSNYTGITGLIETGRNGGVWDGPGITTSMPDATGGSGYTSLGIATGSEARGIGASDTDLWGGQTVTGSDSLVMYTYGGDANLSGNVDIDDYGQIDFNASTGGVLTGWYNGDFDYNGIQDIDDYGVIDFVVGIQGPAFYTAGGLSIAAVPEPASFGLLGAGAMTLLARRRRTR